MVPTSDLHTEGPGNPINGPCELLAESLGPDPEFGGQLVPPAAGGTLVGQVPLGRGQTFSELADEFVEGDRLARARAGGRDVGRVARTQGLMRVFAAFRGQPPGLVDRLVSSDGRQQAEKLLGPLQVVLAQRRPDEEAAEHRLANVLGIEQAAKTGRLQVDSHRTPHDRLILPDQLDGRLRVARPDSAHEVRKGGRLRHGPSPVEEMAMRSILTRSRPGSKQNSRPKASRWAADDISVAGQSSPQWLGLEYEFAPGGGRVIYRDGREDLDGPRAFAADAKAKVPAIDLTEGKDTYPGVYRVGPGRDTLTVSFTIAPGGGRPADAARRREEPDGTSVPRPAG